MTSYSSDVAFDPSQDDPSTGTPTLSSILSQVVREGSRQLRVCLPCAVVKVRGNQLVDLQPLLQVRYVAMAAPTTLPVIPNCPVSMPSGATWGFKFPIAVGDTGLAIFCDRSLDNWVAGSGGVIDPDDVRTHDLTDAIFVPGLVPKAKQTTDATEDMVIRNGTAQVRLEKNGTFRIANQGQELVDLVTQLTNALASLTQTLQGAMVSTMMGPQPFMAFTQSELGQGLSTVNQIVANLKTLQGI